MLWKTLRAPVFPGHGFLGQRRHYEENYFRSMKESEITELIRNTPEEGGLPFFNLAWQNRDRDALQYCMLCYGKEFKGHEAHYLQYVYKQKAGRKDWALTSDWKKLREEYMGFSENRKVQKVRAKALRMLKQNKQHSTTVHKGQGQ